MTLRRVIYLSAVWVPLTILAWWAWGWGVVNGPWMTYHSAKNVTPIVAPGESVYIDWSYEVLHDCPRQIEMRIVDAEGVEVLLYSHSGRTTGRGVGAHEFISELHLPVLKAGKYILVSSSTGHCTPLHSETVRGPPVPLTVVD